MSVATDRIEAKLRANGSRRRGNDWQCPVHKDGNPSLSVNADENGKNAGVYCHGGCATSAVMDALGLTMADLYDVPRPGRVVEDVYPYVDESGRLLFEVVRYVGHKFSQRQYRPDLLGTDHDERMGYLDDDGYLWSLSGVRRVLYRLPLLAPAIAAGRTIYLTEGEKDAHVIIAEGEIATCNPRGAGRRAWRAEYAESLRGAKVVIVRDRDDDGRRHAAEVAASLRGVAASVQIVEAAEGKDAFDHLHAGHTVEDFVAVDDEAAPAEPAEGLRLVTAADFAAVDEESAAPLLGDERETVLSAGGMMVIYGKGGAGKTTLQLDLAMHLAAGAPWLGVTVPRPCRVLLIENEGPRGKMRRKVRAKLAAWGGPDVGNRLVVLDQPWARFSFTSADHRGQLAALIEEHEIDIIAAGPVIRLGMKGGGTPDEIATFVDLIEQARAVTSRPVALLLVHHDNKVGTVSGAWEGVPDTLLNVRAQGNGATRVIWEKTRWSSDLHGKAWVLRWADGEGFEREEKPETTDDDIRLAILAVVEANPGCSANAIEKGCPGSNDRKRAVRDALLEAGDIVNLGGGKGGAGGGGMKLYLPADVPFAAAPANAQANRSPNPGVDDGGTVRRSPPRKGQATAANERQDTGASYEIPVIDDDRLAEYEAKASAVAA